MPCNHLILCCPLFLCLMFPSLRVFSNESALHIRRPKCWSFSISPSFIVKQVFFPLAYLFIYWMHWVFFAFARVFSLAAASRGYSLLPSMVLGHSGSVVVVQGLSCPQACGIFLDQWSNLCCLHWQADSYPLHHQGSPRLALNGKHISVKDPGQSRQTMSEVCSHYCSVLPFSTLLFSSLLSQYCQINSAFPSSFLVNHIPQIYLLIFAHLVRTVPAMKRWL